MSATVLVPKTSVDKDDLPSPGKCQVGGAGQIPSMKAVAITHPMNEVAHFQLGLRVRTADPAHEAAAEFD